MADVHESWCERMCSFMSKMFGAVAAIGDSSLSDSSLQSHFAPMLNLRKRFLELCVTIHYRRLDAPPTDAAQYTLLITSFTSLLTSLVPQLERLGTRLNSATATRSGGGVVESVFWELWAFLRDSSYAFDVATTHMGSTSLPDDKQPFYTSLYPAVVPLLTWLLVMSRSPAWTSMVKKHGRPCRDRELLIILAVPTLCLRDLGCMPALAKPSHLSSLPPTLIPLLCCIVTEQFFSLPPVVPRAVATAAGVTATTYALGLDSFFPAELSLSDLLTLLTWSIANFRDPGTDTPFSARRSFLTAPAVLQMLKAVLTLPPSSLRAEPELVHCSLESLHNLLLTCVHTDPAPTVAPLCAVDRVRNSDDVGLPLHLNAILSAPALETDRRLLHALSQAMHGDAALIRSQLPVQMMVVRGWMAAGRLYDAPPEALSLMASSVVGLAKQCTAYALSLLKRQQQQQQQQQQQAGARRKKGLGASGQPVGQRLELRSAAAQRRDKELLELNADGKTIRDLMYNASEFRLETRDGEPHSEPGWHRNGHLQL
ncbi:MAG: hypothetical protein WDW38_009697 [Sanguina aurantia]